VQHPDAAWHAALVETGDGQRQAADLRNLPNERRAEGKIIGNRQTRLDRQAIRRIGRRRVLARDAQRLENRLRLFADVRHLDIQNRLRRHQARQVRGRQLVAAFG
jgi:hypothetical protein